MQESSQLWLDKLTSLFRFNKPELVAQPVFVVVVFVVIVDVAVVVVASVVVVVVVCGNGT